MITGIPDWLSKANYFRFDEKCDGYSDMLIVFRIEIVAGKTIEIYIYNKNTPNRKNYCLHTKQIELWKRAPFENWTNNKSTVQIVLSNFAISQSHSRLFQSIFTVCTPEKMLRGRFTFNIQMTKKSISIVKTQLNDENPPDFIKIDATKKAHIYIVCRSMGYK